MKHLSKYLKPYIGLIILAVVLTTIQAMTNLGLPSLMATIINQGIIGQDISAIYKNGVFMLLLSLLGGVSAITAGYLASRIATGFAMKMRERVFKKVESFALSEFNKFSLASLLTRTTNDIQQIQQVVFMMMRIMLMAPIMGVGSIYMAYRTAPDMSWIMGAAVGTLIAVIIILYFIVTPRFIIVQKLTDKLNLIARENLTGLRVIRAFNTEKRELKRFDQANQELTKLNLFLQKIIMLIQPLMMLIHYFTGLAIILIGAHFINLDSLPVGNMIAFLQYSMQVLFSFVMMSMVFIMLPRASISAERIAEVLKTDPSIMFPEASKESSQETTALEFKAVGFTYPGAKQPILQNISFTVSEGQTMAIIGSTGSGKSTLINLITRFYDSTLGQIMIDGVDICDYTAEDLLAKIAYVPQRAVLFSGSIADNIKYGKLDASADEIIKAAKTAQAWEFVSAYKNGLETDIAQTGKNLSGGQKQRISIARALIKKPRIYIFDDSFSALDFQTDAKLRTALKNETEHAITLIVAQRISTIINSDKILVLDNGQIAGFGRHEELLSSCSVYREIYESQS